MLLNFSKAKILVVGDIILDKYYHGSVSRISPEAPVPVVLKEYEKTVPGGAANVANNLKKLGVEAGLIGLCGNDPNGWMVSALLKEEGILADIISGDNPTVTKIRIIGGHQQICRLDVEKPGRMSANSRKDLYAALEEQIPRHDLVLISDYDKGVIDAESAIFIINQCKKNTVPVIIDPKKKDWSMYSGAKLLTPNLKEFREACHRHQLDDEDLIHSGNTIREKFNLENLLITLSEKGMLLITEKKHYHIDTVKKEVFDVSGAGDTVIATLAACLAKGMDIKQAVEISNIAAGIVVGKFGTAPVTIAELQIAVEQFKL